MKYQTRNPMKYCIFASKQTKNGELPIITPWFNSKEKAMIMYNYLKDEWAKEFGGHDIELKLFEDEENNET